MRRFSIGHFGGGFISNLVLRGIAVNNRVNNGRDTNTYTNYASRFQHCIANSSSNLVVNMSNWLAPNAGITGTGNAITITAMTIESVNLGTSVQVTWGGSTSITLANLQGNVNADPILPSAFGLTQFSRGELYWVKTLITLTATGLYVPYTFETSQYVTGSQAWWYNPANTTLSSINTYGAFTSTGTAPITRANGFRPMILGIPLVDMPSFFIMGDSIAAGVGEASNNGVYGQGFIQRAMVSSSNTNPIPCMNFAVSGQGYPSYLGSANQPYWTPYLAYCNRGWDELGTNDIQGGSISTVESNSTLMQGLMVAGGIPASKIIRTSLFPRTTSSDTFETAANQTYFGSTNNPPSTINSPNGLADQLNTYFQSQAAAGVYGQYHFMSSIRDTSVPDPDKWLTNGTANYTAYDGTHPSSNGATIAATEMRPVIAALG